MPSLRARMIPLAVTVAALITAATPLSPAAADPDPPVESFTYTANMEPLGASLRANTGGTHNSDLAFWGDRLYQGDYAGFRIIDISNPEDPQLINDYKECTGTTASNQGDVIIWEDLLIRAWNSNAGAGLMCDGQAVPSGFEGLHVFDVSNESDPALIASVDLPCGSHTATGVPDLANNRFLVYASGSSGTCPQIEIVEIPLANPAGATYLRAEPSGRSCHDTSVILGDAMLASCAGGNGFTVWSLGGSRGGTLEDPFQLNSQAVTGVSIAHSHAFSWDGEILIFGHEPGGGSGAQCQASTTEVNKTLFFYETDTFTEVGRWVLPRPQTSAENCTIHNFNVVPSTTRRILVSGSYQSGIGVVDFTNPTAPVEIAYADPAPLEPTQLGGDWSSYWYDGHIYESDITRGLITWRLNDDAVAGAGTLGHLNPQTQENTIRLTICPPSGRFSDDLEPGAEPGWTVNTATDMNTPSVPWAVRPDPGAHSASNSFNTGAAGLSLKDDRLVSPPVDLSSSSQLTFWHRFNLELNRDGGVLEVSTDGGSTWTDVGAPSFAVGGYNGTIASAGSPINGRAAWTGSSASVNAMIPVTVNIGAFAGPDRLIRWRFAQDPMVAGSTVGTAWWVDDVLFRNLSVNCRPIAVDDTGTALNGFPVNIDVLANDSDTNLDPLTVTAVTQGTNGSVTNNGDGTVTYDPVCFQGIDTFTYTISDGNGGTDVGLVTVRVRKTSRRGSIPCQ